MKFTGEFQLVSKRLAKPEMKGSQNKAGSLFSYGYWRAWRDSNPQPLGPKPSTLSVELQAQVTVNNLLGASDGIRTRDLLCHRQAPWTTWLRSPCKPN